VRGRGVEVAGVRGHARLLSALVAGSLERAANLAEAMEARGFGSGTPTRAPGPAWGPVDHAALAAGAALVLMAVLWL
jgi:energy-coupling factor transporter transmembrane protein EcfT